MIYKVIAHSKNRKTTVYYVLEAESETEAIEVMTKWMDVTYEITVTPLAMVYPEQITIRVWN